MSKTRLGQQEKRILLQSMAVRCLELFGRLENETMDLDVFEYFDKYYKRLYKLIYCMELYYPNIDMSANDINTLYMRKCLRD